MMLVDQWPERRDDRAFGDVPVARRTAMPARASAAPLPGWRSEHEVSDQLQRLGVRAAGIENDLADLQRSLTYQLLFDGELVSGVTLARLEPVGRAVGELWLGFGVLSELMAEVVPVVAPGARPELDELQMAEWHLFESSVEVDGRHFTPDELMDELVQALSATAQIVEEVDDVWRHTVPGIARCAEEIEPLLGQAREHGVALAGEHLRQLQAQVSWLTGQAARDPIGVAEAFQRDAMPRLELARGLLRDGLRQQRDVAVELERAQARLAEIRDFHARVVEEAGSVWAKIAHPRGLLAPPDSSYLSEPPMGLEPWLARLTQLCASGSHRPAWRGLQSWQAAADVAVAREQEVLAANRAPLQRRHELRELLTSLKAKAEALGMGFDAGLAGIEGRARGILYTAQTDLDEAASLVKEYGDRLRSVNSKEGTYR
jgi:hypothetical protein